MTCVTAVIIIYGSTQESLNLKAPFVFMSAHSLIYFVWLESLVLKIVFLLMLLFLRLSKYPIIT